MTKQNKRNNMYSRFVTSYLGIVIIFKNVLATFSIFYINGKKSTYKLCIRTNFTRVVIVICKENFYVKFIINYKDILYFTFP